MPPAHVAEPNVANGEHVLEESAPNCDGTRAVVRETRCPSASHQASQHLDHHGGEFVGAAQDGEAAAAEDPAGVARRLAIDGQAEHGDALAARLGDRLARVFDAVRPFVDVDVVRLAVGEDQQEPARRAVRGRGRRSRAEWRRPCACSDRRRARQSDVRPRGSGARRTPSAAARTRRRRPRRRTRRCHSGRRGRRAPRTRRAAPPSRRRQSAGCPRPSRRWTR